MTGRIVCWHLTLAVSIVTAAPASAQFTSRSVPSLIRQVAEASQGELRGVVTDEARQPLAGAVVSAVGATTVFAVTERDGSFSLRNLPAGPYLVRVHLQGYQAPRARAVQVTNGASTLPTLTLGTREESRKVLEAGVGIGAREQDPDAGEPQAIDRGEVAWRLRHVRRSVLKDIDAGMLVDTGDTGQAGWGTALAASSNTSAAGWFGDLQLNGQVNLLTSSAFDTPEQLLSLDGSAATGVTSVALAAPLGAGEWSVQAGLTQGDLTSWLVSGAFERRESASHQYEAGITYGAQRYMGGNAFMMAALVDGSRNVGELFAFDRWSLGRHVQLDYGAKYARYDYLNERGLLSPEVSITVTPGSSGSFRLQAAASRREVAPGAGEFLAPTTGPWLPAQRTFSALSPRNGFSRERVETMEVRADRQWQGGDLMVGARAFRQNVDGQMVTLFGMAQPGSPVASLGHYYVAAGGDFEAYGWGVSAARRVVDGVRASVDYTMTDANWARSGQDAGRLALVAASSVRTDRDRVHDLRASVESEVPQTATRFFVVYKINSGFASADAGLAQGSLGTRFDVQVNQGLPFLKIASSQWEMLIAVRNMFHDELAGASVYDELLVVRAPKRIVGGLSVRF